MSTKMLNKCYHTWHTRMAKTTKFWTRPNGRARNRTTATLKSSQSMKVTCLGHFNLVPHRTTFPELYCDRTPSAQMRPLCPSHSLWQCSLWDIREDKAISVRDFLIIGGKCPEGSSLSKAPLLSPGLCWSSGPEVTVCFPCLSCQEVQRLSLAQISVS